MLSVDSSEIRVLDLEPSHEFDADICCHLRTVSLHAIMEDSINIQPFEALSHVWGSASKDKFVFVDGQPMAVTSSLKSFLRHRRNPTEKVPLWIDTLCIQQSDEQ